MNFYRYRCVQFTANRFAGSLKSFLALALLAGCATQNPPSLTTNRSTEITTPKVSAPIGSDTPKVATVTPAATSTVSANSEMPSRVSAERVSAEKNAVTSNSQVFLGTGQLFKPATSTPPSRGGDTRFNLENTDIREIVRNVLNDTLQENYIIDPAVNGAVTLRTPKGIARGDLIPALEVMLRQVNAVLVRDGDLWRVQPSAAGVRGVGRPGFGVRTPGSGYGLTFVPLKFIGVNEMMRLLDAIVKEPVGQGGAGGTVRPEPLRNMLVIAGTPQETQYILDTIDMFDVDWMSGMSAGLFILEHSEAKKVVEEVDKVLGGLGVGSAPTGAPSAAGAVGLGPLFGLVRVQLIERLNAILVLSPRREMIAQAETWIRRLDRGGSADTSQLYVVPLMYTNAEKLAPILQQAMQGRATQGNTPPPVATAPGQNPLSITTPVAVQAQPTPVATQPPVPPRVAAPTTSTQSGQGSALARNATIIADKDRNALLVVSSPSEFSAIEAAIKKLDVLPKQVMVEVTIVEVDLTDEFAFGVDWAASRNPNVGSSSFQRYADSKGDLGSAGLSLAIKNRDIAGSILNLLDAKLSANDGNKRARIQASPKLMTVDNTPVTFNVGRSVSVQTQTVSTPGQTTSAVTNSFQYLQTGISVSITPRISAGGLVNLEITQDISEPTSSGASGNPNPDISRTALKNTVLAQDGETIVMAGLIREKLTDDARGLPGVARIPLLGGLFGRQGVNSEKQELLVMVRPVVVSTFDQAREVGDELRGKMQLIRDAFGDLKGQINRPSPLGVTNDKRIDGSTVEAQGGLKLSPSLTN